MICNVNINAIHNETKYRAGHFGLKSVYFSREGGENFGKMAIFGTFSKLKSRFKKIEERYSHNYFKIS